MFNKIINAIRSGRCPHVKPNKPTSESTVTAKHAFAAVGNADMIMAETTYVPTSCFGITPYHIAAIHNRHAAIHKLSNIYNFCTLQFPTRIVEDENGVKFILMATNALKLCVDRNDLLTIQSILRGIANAYQYSSPILYAIHQGKTDALDILLASYIEYMNIFHSSKRHEDSFQCTLMAVLSDRPESLAVVLEHLDIQQALYLEEHFSQLHLATSLGNIKCLEILENWQAAEHFEIYTPTSDQKMTEQAEQNVVSPICMILFKLKFHNLRQFKTAELCNVLEKLVHNGCDINRASEDGRTPLHYVCGSNPFFNILVHFTLMKLGADINAKDSNGETPLFHIIHDLEIRRFYNKDCLKWFIRMALYHNPMMCRINHWTVFNNQLTFKELDNVYKGLGNDFIECGFQPGGYTELQPLQKICRNTIRQAFPGYALHRFVDITKLPSSIKNFILLEAEFDWKPHLQHHR